MKNIINNVERLIRKGQDISSHKLKISIFILLIAISACGSDKNNVHHEHSAASAITYTCPMHPQIVEEEPGTCPICGMDLVAINVDGSDSPELMLSESQILLANIETRRAGLGGMNNAVVLSGRVTQNEELTEVVSSRVPGRIEQLYVKETGQQIKKGQPLYDIYSEELLTNQQEYLLALEQYEQLGEEVPRYADFVESARRKLLLYGMTEAQIRQLAARKKTDPRITFLSPVNGIANSISAVEGQYVAEGSRLYTITRLDPLWVEAEVYERDLEKVKKGLEVIVQVEGIAKPVAGTVTFVSPEYREGSQILIMRVEIPNPGGKFIPGMQANVQLPLTAAGEKKEVVTVPLEAVIRDQDGAHVWVRTGENTFEPRKVLTADATANLIVVTEGLQPDDTVVISGAYLLFSEFVLKKGENPLVATTRAENDVEKMSSGKRIEKGAVFKNEQFAIAFVHYLKLKEALVESDAAQASKEAGALQLALQEVPSGKEAAEYAGNISRTSKLTDQREQFFFLSNNFINLSEQQALLSGKVFVQFCPMANQGQGAYWLSAMDEIRNPYLPENMLTCGEVKKVIE